MKYTIGSIFFIALLCLIDIVFANGDVEGWDRVSRILVAEAQARCVDCNNTCHGRLQNDMNGQKLAEDCTRAFSELSLGAYSICDRNTKSCTPPSKCADCNMTCHRLLQNYSIGLEMAGDCVRKLTGPDDGTAYITCDYKKIACEKFHAAINCIINPTNECINSEDRGHFADCSACNSSCRLVNQPLIAAHCQREYASRDGSARYCRNKWKLCVPFSIQSLCVNRICTEISTEVETTWERFPYSMGMGQPFRMSSCRDHFHRYITENGMGICRGHH